MSERMPLEEFRQFVLAASYFARVPNPPRYFGDLFELVAYAEGEFTRVDTRYFPFAMDAPEKLGLVHDASENLELIESEMKGLGLVQSGTPQYKALSDGQSRAKYHGYMLIWGARALLDCLSVHLNATWRLGFSGKDTWMGSSKFRDRLREKRSGLACALDRHQQWFSTVDEFRLLSIHREPLVLLANGDPSAGTGWRLCVPTQPHGAWQRLLDGQLHDLQQVATSMGRDWCCSADTVTQAVFEDTIAAVKGGDAPSNAR